MLTLCLLLLVVLHELGHVVAAEVCGLRWKPTVVRLRGIPIAPAIGVFTPDEGTTVAVGLALALSGPAASLLAAAALWTVAPVYAVMSALLGIVSLVPVRPQDGWHALNAIRSTRTKAVAS